MIKIKKCFVSLVAMIHVTSQSGLFIVQLDKTTRSDWLISGPSKAVLDRPKDVLDREIEDLLQ